MQTNAVSPCRPQQIDYRPITLMNLDAKYLNKALVNKTQMFIKTYIPLKYQERLIQVLRLVKNFKITQYNSPCQKVKKQQVIMLINREKQFKNPTPFYDKNSC